MKFEYIIFFSLIVIVGSQLLLKNVNINGIKKENKLTNELGNFPNPQISRGFEQLSKLKPLNSLFIQNNKKIDESEVNIIRSNNVDNDKNPIYYKPEFYKKDFISPNPIGSTEYNFAEFNDDKTSYAWTNNNVSQHPSFYRSEIENERTNVGEFFDVNNKYNDKTSVYSTNNLPDRCFLDKDDLIVCNFNDKLQNIPPSLIKRDNKVDFLNRIGNNGDGLYKDISNSEIDVINGNNYLTYEYKDEKEMNGAEVFNGVHASSNKNETYLDLKTIDGINNVTF